jgi:serine/threonine protein kinase/tetratricopeptide (TPR) repeat protein
MTAERWQKLKDLCHLALEREPSQRAPFLAKVCSDDDELRREAESLLARASLDAATLDAATLDDPPHELADKVISHYHLLQKIGEGGMGEVWLAEQKEPVRRRVALKLVKAGMNTREVIGRFESERQALALMEHPAIAKVFDAGSTVDGAPYFVMEYVAGVPLTDYCDNHRLSIKERLELFMQVCEGVRHAHQKAVIHRDLKPSNILVEELDGRPVPKIIDFGVAKALSQKLTAHTMFTRVGSLIGTPEYMSPEQALSSGEDVDTRTDVYSLGIIFYELLAGAPPIELRKIAFDEFLRRLREEDPPKPSTKIRTGDAATKTELARRRQTEPVALARQIGGDLDSIALKALEKDRGRRYESASDFAADIARYLRDEAVQAVPPSAVYRARKFASRHRWGLAMASAFVVVLAAAAVISIRQTIRANREAAIAEAVSNFLRNDVLAQASPNRQLSPKPNPDLKVRTALDQAAMGISGKFEPDVEAAVRQTIGQTYEDVGLYPKAKEQFERALELRRQTLGAKDPKTLQSVSSVGTILLKQGKFPDAEAILRPNLDMQIRLLGPKHPNTLATMHNLGVVYTDEGKYGEAEAIHSNALEIRRRVLGPDDPLTLSSMTALANAYEEDGKFDRSEPLYTQALEIYRRVSGAEHPRTLGVMNDLANVYYDEGKFSEAEKLYAETLDLRRQVLGPEHPETLSSMMNLAIMYRKEGKREQAEELYGQTLEIDRRVLGPEHRVTLMCMNNLANLYFSQGKWAEAEALQAQTLDVKRRVLGAEHPDTLLSMHNLANSYAQEGKYAQAEALFAQALEAQRRKLGPQHGSTLSTLSDFALMRLQQGKYTLAETYYTEVLAGRRQALGPEHPETMSSVGDLAVVYILEGKSDASEPLARQTLDFTRKNEPGSWDQFCGESVLGASLAGQKKYTEAEALLTEGYQGMLARKGQVGAPGLYYLDLGKKWLVQMYVARGKPEKAAEWRKK